MTDLRDLVDIVQTSRNYTAGSFPLPDVDSCIDYAITEAAEHLDAVLREKRNGDKRNNDKQHNPRKEWGQCGYMIASGIIQNIDEYCDEWDSWREPNDVDVYCVISGLCDVAMGTSDGAPEVSAFDDWHAFCLKNGWNPADLLRETCAAFEVKHVGRAFTVVDKLSQADVDEINKAFVYTVLTAEQAAAQGEVFGSA